MDKKVVMPIYVRIVRDGKWLSKSEVGDDRSGEFDWLSEIEDAVPCQIMEGIGSLSRSEMSLFLLRNPSYLTRLAAAWAIKTGNYNIKFAYLKVNVLEDLDLKIEQQACDLPDDKINEWHRSLVQVDIESLGKITRVLYKAETKLLSEPIIEAAILESAKEGWVKPNKLPKKYRKIGIE